MQPTVSHRARKAMIDPILDALREESEVAPLAVPFAERYLAGLASEDLIQTPATEHAAAILSLLRLAHHRVPGRSELRVFNPDREEDGWPCEHTVIQVVNDDMPFLVDSITGELSALEIGVHQVVHPQVTVRRDSGHNLVQLAPQGSVSDGLIKESFMHIEIHHQSVPSLLVKIQTTLQRLLEEIRQAVTAWPEMRGKLVEILAQLRATPPPLPRASIEEGMAFLEWVEDHHFTFLGYRVYDLVEHVDQKYLVPVAATGIGTMAKMSLDTRVAIDKPLKTPNKRFFDSDRLLSIAKANRRSRVHRRVHLDLISIKRFDDEGELLGEHRFMGLFTSRAYNIPASRIPILRRKVKNVISQSGFLPASHDAKALRAILERFPRDELLQISGDDLFAFSLRILQLQLRPRLALLVRRDEAERFLSCMVFIPRDLHTTQLRERIQSILEAAFAGEVTAYYTQVSDQPLAQVQLIVKTRPGHILAYDVEKIEAQLAAMARTWSDQLREALVVAMDEARGLDCWRRYRDAFPLSYREHGSVATAVEDLPAIENVLATGKLGLRLYRIEGAARDHFHVRTFERAVAAPLSDFLPMLENMGVIVQSEIPFMVRPPDATNPVWIRDFSLVAEGNEVDLDDLGDRFTATFKRLWSRDVENDGFNRLVLHAGLTWRQAMVLRAYCRYLRQTGIAFGQHYMANTLARNPRIARQLVELFEARFDPERTAAPPTVEARLEAIHDALEGVKSRDEDRILHRFLNLVQHTLRTNYFQTAKGDKPKTYLAFKLDSRRLRGLPPPRPEYEIFVYSPRMEAVHLRGGAVARGGIRWSDRREDFRTEILGLMKAQRVKNAVIVPVGAKGGFVVKRPPAGGDREALLAEGKACYTMMIRGLLDLTDNLVDGTVTSPQRVVRRDGDDPYLVVAADKGTATFSDLANRIAAQYDFWLGDAFASGGSAGYDHKKMGITARGAWESVKRHFREMGTDIQRQRFTVVGVGDMSGDVFGNGMLLSEHIALVGAFNHLHIFVDPDPDPAISYAERQRLFKLPSSTWDSYDRKLLSAGGAVYDRQAKTIEVDPQVQKLFGLPRTTTTPLELIRAMLCAPVSLLWFGGIGTYVKASHESNARADDRTNNDLRVNANQLRTQVIGEGANLGVTQAGRIELATRGVRINTDFIDNSGGVDCSDHEVNIKIALAGATAAGHLDRVERDRLLEAMTDEVAALVLHDNYLQAQAISVLSEQGAALLDEQAQLMHELERDERLDRRLENLPDDATLTARRDAKLGLTRPELAVLLAYGKIYLYNELVGSGMPDEPELVEDLVRYFPAPMQRRFREQIETHRLRREIVATHVTNSLVNRVGPTFAPRLAAETGRSMSDIARAYTAARDVFDLRTLWETIEGLDNQVAADVQIAMIHESLQLAERATRWFLRYGGQPLNVLAVVNAYRSAMDILTARLWDFASTRRRGYLRRHAARLEKAGVATKLAARVAGLRMLLAGCDIIRCARNTDQDAERVGRIYFTVGERFGIDPLRRAAEKLTTDTPWQKAAVINLSEDLASHQAEITRRVVATNGKKGRAAVEAWVAERRERIERLDQQRAAFGTNKADLAILMIAERDLRDLVEQA